MNQTASTEIDAQGRDDGTGSHAASVPPVESPRLTLVSLLKLVLVAIAVVGLVFGVYLWEDLAQLIGGWLTLLLPPWFRLPLLASAWFLLVAALAPVLRRRPTRVGRWTVPAKFWDDLDRAASWALGGGLAVVLTTTAVVLFAGWLPHYLVWPWWTDTGYFALTAQAWEAGILPYRDLFDFNFPGPTYLHWMLGKVFGWGHTMPFQAFDAALIAALGFVLTAWSRKHFGGATPGLVGYLAVLAYYMSQNYAMVGQRDWQAPLFVVLGLLMLETWKDRWISVGSALLFAMALSIRPHPVVLAPALFLALDESARPEGDSWKITARAAAWWSVVVVAGLIAAAAPVVLAGVADDFVRWFKFAWYGSGYDQHGTGMRNFYGEVLGPLKDIAGLAVFAGLVAMAVKDRPHRRLALTWLTAFLGVLLYKPLSPQAHYYLDHPSSLVWCVGLAVVTGWIWTAPSLVPTFRVLLVATIVLHAHPWTAPYWRPRASVVALNDLIMGREPIHRPPGCSDVLDAGISTPFLWGDYSHTLAYLRDRTGPRTRVGAFFRNYPFPTVNAPVGRLPLFPSPGGVLWLRFAAPGLEAPFAEALEQADDAVVVWTPGVKPEHRLQLPGLEEIVRNRYEPEARFGRIEIWRKKAEPAERSEPMASENQDG